MTEKNSAFLIEHVTAREILDCRGDPTLQVDVRTRGGVTGTADVPSGRSVGRYEAVELRDGGARYGGRGVLKAISNVRERIAPALKGMDVRDQRGIDQVMIQLDGSERKSNLGANATVGVSLAVAKAAAASQGMPLYRYVGGPEARVLPVPFLNLINGGRHAATELDFQEHMVVPVRAESFSDALRKGTEVYHELGQILARKWGKRSLNVADEGGYTPPGMREPQEAFEAELEAIEELAYEDDFVLALDAAASHLYDPHREVYRLMGRDYTARELMDFYEDLVSTYPVKSIEDPFQEEDFESFSEMTKGFGIQVVGDDLFVTNIRRLRRGVELEAGNAILWKVNQVGTLTEAMDACRFAFKHGYRVQVSERSGQTEDTWLADLSVATGSGQVKTGAPCRGERTSQYNRLLRIEEELAGSSEFPRRPFWKS